MPAWTAKLTIEGWEVAVFSIAEHIAAILQAAPQRQLWLTADARAPLAWDKTNRALANALANGALQARLESALQALEARPNALLLVTGLEALHPYLRIGAIESRLQGKFSVPAAFLNPGERTGKTRLKILGFHPDDGFQDRT